MTTADQNRWAQLLEGATAREIRQMAEYAIDHIDGEDELKSLIAYVNEAFDLASGS